MFIILLLLLNFNHIYAKSNFEPAKIKITRNDITICYYSTVADEKSDYVCENRAEYEIGFDNTDDNPLKLVNVVSEQKPYPKIALDLLTESMSVMDVEHEKYSQAQRKIEEKKSHSSKPIPIHSILPIFNPPKPISTVKDADDLLDKNPLKNGLETAVQKLEQINKMPVDEEEDDLPSFYNMIPISPPPVETVIVKPVVQIPLVEDDGEVWMMPVFSTSPDTDKFKFKSPLSPVEMSIRGADSDVNGTRPSLEKEDFEEYLQTPGLSGETINKKYSDYNHTMKERPKFMFADNKLEFKEEDEIVYVDLPTNVVEHRKPNQSLYLHFVSIPQLPFTMSKVGKHRFVDGEKRETIYKYKKGKTELGQEFSTDSIDDMENEVLDATDDTEREVSNRTTPIKQPELY